MRFRSCWKSTAAAPGREEEWIFYDEDALEGGRCVKLMLDPIRVGEFYE
ncbi:hypothetical protein AVEN_86215-1, partial [Araneus ventricosus]